MHAIYKDLGGKPRARSKLSINLTKETQRMLGPLLDTKSLRMGHLFPHVEEQEQEKNSLYRGKTLSNNDSVKSKVSSVERSLNSWINSPRPTKPTDGVNPEKE